MQVDIFAIDITPPVEAGNDKVTAEIRNIWLRLTEELEKMEKPIM